MDIQEFQKMNDEILRLDRLNIIGELAASIGHEIRNPLTAVRGYLQLFKLKNNDQEKAESLNIMIEELDKANSIISEYLSLAKNKSLNLKLQSLNEIIKVIFPLIQADALMSDKLVELELEDIPDLYQDEKEIRQLILHLTRNGLEAMKKGGKLRIRTYLDNTEVVLSIRDHGKGIEPDLLGKVCHPFFTTKENGTGMGLAICSNIIKRHQARLSIESNTKGTTFLVKFQVPKLKAITPAKIRLM
jgi:signal transduction histidine kinase